MSKHTQTTSPWSQWNPNPVDGVESVPVLNERRQNSMSIFDSLDCYEDRCNTGLDVDAQWKQVRECSSYASPFGGDFWNQDTQSTVGSNFMPLESPDMRHVNGSRRYTYVDYAHFVPEYETNEQRLGVYGKEAFPVYSSEVANQTRNSSVILRLSSLLK